MPGKHQRENWLQNKTCSALHIPKLFKSSQLMENYFNFQLNCKTSMLPMMVLHMR